MSESWADEGARESFIRFLQLELELSECASSGRLDPGPLEALKSLLDEHFPRTREYIERKFAADAAQGPNDEIRTMAWAEARSRPGLDGLAHVPGTWTEREISLDINDCYREAVCRLEGRDRIHQGEDE